MNRAIHKNMRMRLGMVACAVGAVFFYAGIASAVTIEKANGELANDFVLMPAKIEVSLDPGGSVQKDITVVNRTSESKKFTITTEDFTGSNDPSQPTVLLGDKTGPYSLKDFIKPEVSTFTLNSGEKITFFITIDIPKDAEPGGLYGTVLVTSMSGNDAVPLISRLGGLLFVRVNGDAKESGKLEKFRTIEDKTVFTNGSPKGFALYYKNDGSVHTNPYGYIEVKNMLGVAVDRLEVVPYFAMPQSLRFREIVWERSLLWGKYKATAFINRGYGDIVDELSLEFWVLPWKNMALGLGGIFIVIFLLRWVFGNYSVIRKSRMK